jgi:hypothetical protein
MVLIYRDLNEVSLSFTKKTGDFNKVLYSITYLPRAVAATQFPASTTNPALHAH